MTITFENDNDVIVYALEKVIAYARRTQQIFVAQCIWWLASIIGLDQELINHFDKLQSRFNVTITREEAPSVPRAVSPIPRDNQKDQRQDKVLKECEEFLRESRRLREAISEDNELAEKVGLSQTHQDTTREVSVTPRDRQEDARLQNDIHPDRRRQIASSTEAIESDKESIPKTRKERKAFNRQKQVDWLSRVRSGKVTKPLTPGQKKYLQCIPKDTIKEYLENRK
jgi:hypothetical protein